MDELPGVLMGEEMMLGKRRVLVYETLSMGKCIFVEKQRVIHGVRYFFEQWKGVGTNAVNEDIRDSFKAVHGRVHYPFGDKGVMPLMLLEASGRTKLWFRGGAFYEDLLMEAKTSKKMTAKGLRVPKILTTSKFERCFAKEHDLPIPTNDKPGSLAGETLREYVEKHRHLLSPTLFKRLLTAKELREGYRSAILGQNVRAFRNIFRVYDLEMIMDDPSIHNKREKIRKILQLSADILSHEVGKPLSIPQFVLLFGKLMEKQSALLTRHRIFHKGFLRHSQDVTLAAEICDVDGDVGNASTSALTKQEEALKSHVACVLRAQNFIKK